jgi:hypothetical protein
MISDRNLVVIQRKGTHWQTPAMTRAEAARWLLARRSWPTRLRQAQGGWFTTRVPSCRCCGEVAWPNLRCTKHQDRNPCAAEGCQRTRAAHGQLSDEASLCGEHWRAFVPPGSPARQAFNRLARVAKKAGYKRTDVWPRELEDRWWLLWRGVMRRVRRDADGHIDEKAIRAMFGWADEG